MRLLTLNLWWGAHHQAERLQAARDLVARHSPDFIAFQEVSTTILDSLRELFGEYQMWPSVPGHAGLAILTKQPWLERGQLRLTSLMGRQLIWYRNVDFLLATVHLESMRPQAPVRIDQLKEVFAFLHPYDRVALVGDFNFAPDYEENRHLHPDYLDAWSYLRPEEPGYTEDTDINLMRLAQKGKKKQVRFDRILTKGGLKPLKIDLVGTVPLPGLRDVWVSDHFGLVCDLEFTEEAPAPTTMPSLLLLGRTYQEYGTWEQQCLGQAVACISVGGDPSSPSLAYKGDKEKGNEDGLLVINDGSRYLLAVADGHFGNQTSHILLERLEKHPIPKDAAALADVLEVIQEPELMVGSGSTLTVAVYNSETRAGFGLSTGDSSLVAVSESSFRLFNPDNCRFFYFNNPLLPEEWVRFEYELDKTEALLLYSDGINECHYRSPETSIQPSHIQKLWSLNQSQPQEFAGLLTQLALLGVNGNPGGQDNIALIVVA